jgi:serine/threonine-protein kinase RsbW
MGRRSHTRGPRRCPARRAKRSGVAYRRGIGIDLLLSEAFDHGRITELRHAVASCAAGAGLAGDRLDDFVVAVNELLTNAVQHGGGRGRVSLWCSGASVVCEVVDHGEGMPDGRSELRGRPAPDQPGGRGLWLAAELTDALEIRTGRNGTSVRISRRAP